MIYHFRDLEEDDRRDVLCHQAAVIFAALAQDYEKVKKHLSPAFIEELDTAKEKIGEGNFTEDNFIDYLTAHEDEPLNKMFKNMVEESCGEILYTFNKKRSVIMNVDEHRGCKHDHDDGDHDIQIVDPSQQ